MTSDLRVKKEPLPASVYLDDGTVLSGTVFLSPRGPTHSGLETIEELMSEPEAVLPFRTEEGRTILIGKAAIVAVRMVSAEAPADFEDRILVDMHMRGGAHFAGRIHVAGESHRPSDIINHAGPWLKFETDGGIVWIRRTAILMASPDPS